MENSVLGITVQDPSYQNLSETKEALYLTYKVTDGKKDVSFFLSILPDTFRININLNNSMQRAFRSMGKDFTSWENALEHYKSDSMQKMIQSIRERSQNDLCVEWCEYITSRKESHRANLIGFTLEEMELLTADSDGYSFHGNEAGLNDELIGILSSIL